MKERIIIKSISSSNISNQNITCVLELSFWKCASYANTFNINTNIFQICRYQVVHSLCEFHALIRKLLMYIRSPYPKTISEMVFHKQVTLGKQDGFHLFVSFLFRFSKIKKSFYTCHKISNNMLLDAITCLQCRFAKSRLHCYFALFPFY